MTNWNVEEFLKRKALKFTRVHEESGPHLIVNPCPLCSSKGSGQNGGRPFYINENTGQYNTYCCSQKGNMHTLRKHFGETKVKKVEGISFDKSKDSDIVAVRERMRSSTKMEPEEKGAVKTVEDVERWHLALCSDQEAMEYLTDTRRLSIETIEHFKLGLVVKDIKQLGSKHKYIAIPSVLDGDVRVLKLRLCMNKVPDEMDQYKWVRFKGMQSHIFNEVAIHEDDDRKRIFICEAELDAIACHQMGLRPAVAVTTGASNFKDEWVSLFEDYEEIMFMYDQFDSDPKTGKHVGDEGAEKAASKLGKFRCKRVVFPFHDMCRWMESNPTRSQIDDVISLAVPYYKADIESVYDASIRVSTTGNEKPTSTGIDSIDKLLGGGLLPGEVMILTADTSIGKTTAAVNIARSMSENGIKTLYWPIEGTVDAIVKKVWTQVLWNDWTKVKDSDPSKFQSMLNKIKNIPMYVWGKGYQPHDVVYNLLSVFARRGGKVLVIDHIHKLVMLEKSNKTEREKIDSWVASVCEWAKEFGLSIICISHPSKPKTRPEDENDESFEPDLHDGKGSSSIYQDPDIYLVLSRTRTKSRDSADETSDFVPTKATLKKMRDDRSYEGSTVTIFHRASNRYISVPEAVKIGYKASSSQPESNNKKKGSKHNHDEGKVVEVISFRRGYTREVDE